MIDATSIIQNPQKDVDGPKSKTAAMACDSSMRGHVVVVWSGNPVRLKNAS